MYQLLCFNDNTNTFGHSEYQTEQEAIEAMEKDFLDTCGKESVADVMDYYDESQAGFDETGSAWFRNYHGINYDWEVIELDPIPTDDKKLIEYVKSYMKSVWLKCDDIQETEYFQNNEELMHLIGEVMGSSDNLTTALEERNKKEDA